MTGFIRPWHIGNLKGYRKVRVVLVAAGEWEKKCGEDIPTPEGYFSITCDWPNTLPTKRNLYVYHRIFYGSQCRFTVFQDVGLSKDTEWRISSSDSGTADESQCPVELYPP
ncbi:unnamed protein product [Bursaphelenchus xylophilus]|nr:unnamed protein product [Bursaphelenchus xylophilus]CAG9104943.1 unnamed protein product [Bursaphelenchus xylophilus]